MDLEHVLAKFRVPNVVESRSELDLALSELLVAIAKSNADVPSILNSLACTVHGLLEAALTSRHHNAFKFRGQVLKEAQKSSSSEIPALRTSAECLGAFLVDLPQGTALDGSVTESFNGFMGAIAALQSAAPGSSTIPQKTDQQNSTSTRQGKGKALVNDHALVFKASEKMTRFLQIFFTRCTDHEMEEFAMSNLFTVLTSINSSSSPLESKQTQPGSPTVDKHAIEVSTPLHSASASYLPLSFEEIVKHWEDERRCKSGDWPIVFSQRAIQQIKRYTFNKSDLSLQIQKKIKQLSVGFFPPPNQTKLLDQDSRVPLYTAELGEDLRLIYQVDFGSPTRTSDESQFLRIFAVLPKSAIDLNFWRSVAAQLSRRGSAYIQRCCDRAEVRLRFKGVETTPPKILPSLEASQCHLSADVEVNEAHNLELHRVIALEKFIPFSQTFFDAIQNHDGSSLISETPSDEHKIIYHPSSCIVLGRSGTGKTRCLVFRMLALDLASESCSRPVRQMFVTQSPKLARQVRSQFLKMKQTEDASELSLEKLESEAKEGILPAKFSELSDSHFPLFVSFDQLCSLLEADYDLHLNPTGLPASGETHSATGARGPLISFDYFKSNIWPRFEGLKKGHHPTIVYNEILGVIKGSEASLATSKCYIDRNAYETQGNKIHFTHDTERARVYTLFETYSKLRPSNSVHILLKAVHDNGVPGKNLDFLYVDEVQDDLLIDVALFRSLCPNPHGLFFAGDTAQMISNGTAFRFNELKSILYRFEREDVNVKRGSRKPIDPQFFLLSTNRRSHRGIVNVAAFIVSLLDQYFQHSIDTLPPEVPFLDVAAHKPVFLSNRPDVHDFQRFISQGSGEVGLGAHQVIIVRDGDAARTLKEDIGLVALILTLYESKGMEFNDVILYNFFEDSLATATDWRALLHSQQDGKPFDERRHSILQMELKSLYVGLTRAKERVWIWNRSEKGREMQALLVNSFRASSHEIDQPLPSIAVPSPPAEWLERARHFFLERMFSEASFCFRKAGMGWWAAVASAFEVHRVAFQSLEADPDPQRHFTLNNVAQEFYELAVSAENRGEVRNSRPLFLKAAECSAVTTNHGVAAKAFFKLEEYTKSAYHYRMAGMFDDAVQIVNAHAVEPAVAESITYAAKIVYAKMNDIPSLQKASQLCASKDEFLEFLQDHGLHDQQIIFLDSIRDYEYAGELLLVRKDYAGAILRFCRANTPSLLSRAGQCLLTGIKGSVLLAGAHGQSSGQLLQLFGLRDKPTFSESDKTEVDLLYSVASLQLAELEKHAQHCYSSQDYRAVVLALDAWFHSGAFQALESTSHDRAAEILNLCRLYSSSTTRLVSTKKWLKDPRALQVFGLALDPESIDECNITVQPNSPIFRVASSSRGASGDAITQRGLTISERTAHHLIQNVLYGRLIGILDRVESVAQHSKSFDLCPIFLTTGECNATGRGRCQKDHIPANQLTVETFNSQFRLHILLIHILALSRKLQPTENGRRSRLMKEGFWSRQLFRLCYPSTPSLGCISDITPAMIPEYEKTMPIVESWLKDRFDDLWLPVSTRRQSDPEEILYITLLATAFNRKESEFYLSRIGSMLAFQTLLRGGLSVSNDQSLLEKAVPWFSQGHSLRTQAGVLFLEEVFSGRTRFDANLAVLFAEEFCAQLLFNNYIHLGRCCHGLTMPRSWMLRAIVRGASTQPNGSVPCRIVVLLAKFINYLLLRKDNESLHLQGQVLYAASPAARSHLIWRLCKCLALIGCNIQQNALQSEILAIFRGLCQTSDTVSGVYKYSTAETWANVVTALSWVEVPSRLDELVTVCKEGHLADDATGRVIVCGNDESIVEQLTLTEYPTAIALSKPWIQQQTPAQSLTTQSLRGAIDGNNIFGDIDNIMHTRGGGESSACAVIIRRFFRRCGPPAGGAVVQSFLELAERRVENHRVQKSNSHWLLCVRGPLPHAFTFLKTLKEASRTALLAHNEAVQASFHMDLDDLYAKRLEIRRIQNRVAQLITDLRPSSDFYLEGNSGSPASVSQIVDKVREVPGLLSSIREFVPCREDDDYALGVEPLLSDRAPWVPKKSGWKKWLFWL